MDGTTAITNKIPKKSEIGNHNGIFIDIFPYDVIPDTEEERTALVNRRNIYMEKLQRVGRFDTIHPVRSIRLLKYRFCYSQLYGEFERQFRVNNINDNTNVSCVSFVVDFEHFLRNKHRYDETIYMPFEDVRMPVPFGYDEILKRQYGDYLKPVKCPAYHSYWKLDAERAYTEYLPEYRKWVNKYWRNSFCKRISKLMRRMIRGDISMTKEK